MDFINLIGSFVKNLAISGSIVALSLTLLDYIGENINYVGFYAFLSGSFFLVNLLQYYKIHSINKKSTKSFLLHSIIGGIFWVLNAIILYIAYENGFSRITAISISFNFFIIVSIIYFILSAYNVFKF
jgi:hypothetical protein